MAVTKRTRFEVLRRDGHRCRYCGVGVDAVTLRVDHVVPKALGGTDDPSNLATACEPCNTGKAATSPDEQHVADVAAVVLRYRQAIVAAAAAMLADRGARRADHDRFLAAWEEWVADDGTYLVALPASWRDDVDRWRASGVPIEVLCDLVETAMTAPRVPSGRVWRYLAGCAWRRVADLQETALDYLQEVSAGVAS